MDKLIIVRDCLRKSADTIDEMIELNKKEERGNDVEKELELVEAKLFINLAKLNKACENL